MRADRLVAILLLLQTRGHVTAGEVAAELEVSERTARRDLEALGMAGLPVYSPPARPVPPHLEAVQRAVVEGEQVTLGYVARTREATTRVVHPLGLAAKGEVWYLVANTDAGLRTFRVDRMTSVEPTGERVVRPDG